MVVGLKGPEISPQEIEVLRRVQPGAVILFERNIASLKQLSVLNRKLESLGQSLKTLPILIALDQEGGRVVRLRTNPRMPSPLAFGLLKDHSIAAGFWKEMHQVMRGLGVHMNLAPVLDVLPENKPSFIGDRAFSSSEDKVTQMGLTFAMSAIQSKMIPTAKHFPGSGHVTVDPHDHLATSPGGGAGLKPFRVFADLFPTAIMLSHVIYPELEPARVPATYSPLITQNLLRKEWGYQGLIITDDLKMKGAGRSARLGTLAVSALRAGSDMVMVSWSKADQLEVHRAISKALQKQQLPTAFEKIERIARAKEFVQLSSPRPLVRQEGRIWSSENLKALDQKMLEANFQTSLQTFPGGVWPRATKWRIVSLTKSFGEFFVQKLGSRIRHESFEDYADLRSPQIQKDEMALVPISKLNQLRWLKNFSKAAKQKTVVVLLSPATNFDASDFFGVVKLYHPHSGLGPLLAQQMQ